MVNNLFFEGPVRSGKSTILRRTLLPYLSDLGGFVVQRLLDQNGSPVAYRLIGLGKIRGLGASGEALFLAVNAPLASLGSNEMKDIFLWTGARETRLDVFDAAVTEIHEARSAGKLVLMDEIGGVDLLHPGFRQALTDVLESGTPCLGIVKEMEKARDARSFNRELRALLCVQAMSLETVHQAPEIILSFLSSILLSIEG